MTDDTTLSGTSGTDKTKGRAAGAAKQGVHFLGLLLFGAALVFIGWLIAVTLGFTLWAHFLGHRIDGSMINGFLWGISLGFVCSFIPLVIARQALRGFGFGIRAFVLLLAALVALPNIATLSIRFGSGRSAHVSERVLSTDAPGIYTGTYTGIVIGVAAFLLLVVWGIMRWNDKRKTRKLSRKLAEMAGDAADSAD